MHVASRFVLLAVLVMSATARAQAQAAPLHSSNPHSTEEWALVAPHLPDPVTAAPEKLETAGDVLRARRFPDDAIMFYRAAALNGGAPGRLLKKQGVVHLELQHGVLARACFQQAVHVSKKDAEGWNNLGAADFMLGDAHRALGEYRHAVKLDKSNAVFHSNLALAYFETRNARAARQELSKALALDPEILHRGGAGGYNLQILASTHYAEICYEMARVYAAQGERETAIVWLTKAAERGLDVRAALKNDAQLAAFLQDDQVQTMLANNDQMRRKDLAGTHAVPPRLSPAGLPQ